MKQVKIVDAGNPHLFLFFAGWSMDPTPFLDYRPAQSDLMICYDYRSLDFDVTSLGGYRDIELVAWSMGVWAASQSLKNSTLPISRRTAVGGTLSFIDPERGIPEPIFRGTLEGLDDRSLAKFQRRMCGSGVAYAQFAAKAPQRSVAEVAEELALLGERYRLLPPSDLRWDEAYIGTADRIFDAEAQQKAWEGLAPIRRVDAPHYCEPLFRHLLQCEV